MAYPPRNVRGFVVSSTSNLYFQQNGEETFDIDQYLGPLLSKTGTNLATRVANGGFTCPELEF
jgi:hypothetical protein